MFKLKIKNIIKTGNIGLLVAFIIAISLIVIVQSRHIGSLYAPWVNNDEIGYWGSAAYFAGYNWSEILKYGAYYSYGYGFMLFPLFILFEDPVMLYRAAIILNIIFMIIVFLIAYRIVRLLYDSISQYMSILLALIALLTTNVVTYAEIAWSETLILVLTWFAVFSFIKYLRSLTKMYLLLFTLCNIYIYMVHQRMLGLVIASSLMIIFCTFKKKISFRHMIYYFIILSIGIAVSTVVKNDIQSTLWEGTNYVSTIGINDYTGQIGKLKAIFNSVFDFGQFIIKSVIGKIFYLEFASLFLFLPGGYFFIKKLKDRNYETEEMAFFFMFLSVMGMLAVESIFVYNPERNDGIIYGRYVETLVGPLILMTFANLLNQIESKKVRIPLALLILGYCINILIIYFIKYHIWDSSRQDTFFLMIPAMVRYVIDGEFYIMKYSLESLILVAISIIIVKIYYSDKRYFKRVLPIISMGFIIISIMNANAIFDIYIMLWQQQKKEIIEIIDDNRTQIDLKKNVYFLFQNDFNSDANRNVIQFALRDKNVLCLTMYDNTQLERGDLLFVNITNPLINEVELECDLIEKNDIMAIFQVK